MNKKDRDRGVEMRLTERTGETDDSLVLQFNKHRDMKLNLQPVLAIKFCEKNDY